MSTTNRSRPSLIKTKLSIPQLRASFVSRPRLLNLLSEGITYELTLICAPAGYGKTSLLVEWVADLERAGGANPPKVCWLSLDAADSDPALFWSYLVAAIKNVHPQMEGASLAIMSAFPPPPFQTAISVLVNELLDQNSAIILVLEDYQFVSNPEIHEGMAFFLDHLPANVHLVMATRSDPPLPLARLRARNQLMEIRANDLQFSLEETIHLLNQIMKLRLTVESISRLEERTEGWVAGLQMAALALRSQLDPSSFVRNFSGSNRYILDYLVEEVLHSQPENIYHFLLQTSILENLSGPLCDAVTGLSSANGVHSSQEILEYLERANLFLVSLDTERIWYRYHHLFADLLRARLPTQHLEDISSLHLRASEWYQRNQQMPEAINHALAAKDFYLARRLIEQVVEQLIARNEMHLLLGWIRQLPTEISTTCPWLCIAQAWSALFTSDAARIEPLLQSAEQNIRRDDDPVLQKTWRGHIACLRAFVADVQGDITGTIAMAQLALVSYRLEDSAHRAFARYMLGRAYFIQGDFPRAIETLTENVSESIRAGTTNIIAPTLSALSMIYRLEGRLQEADDRLQEGRAYIEKCDPRRVTVAGVAYYGQADNLRERNELAAAENLAQRSLELCESWLNPTSMCVCYSVLVRVYQALGKFSAAEEALHAADESIKGHAPFPEVTSYLNAVSVGYWLATGQLPKASHWAQKKRKDADRQSAFSIPNEQDEITLARVLLAEGNFEIVLRTLERLALAAEAGQRFGRLIEIQNLQALALHAVGDTSKALILLQKSLALAEPPKYIRMFLDEGEPMQELLQAYLHTSSPLQQSYAQELLAAFTGIGRAAAPQARLTDLIEPLTERELDVLHLLAEGLSNRQIAEKLVLSEGTIKFHVHNVLEKLQVHTRAQAIVSARKHHLL
ncbi:MAG TPA: LuxR C-terminal-related transcriptional regulator [Anaerolineae bacterium]|nr:LuxR C-terminal-related transcriptional regulator [Anaerolineae bacterium]